jgi:N-acetylneuraminate synthase
MLRQETERAWQALGSIKYGGTQAEEKSRAFRRTLYIARPMRAGEVLTAQNMRILRPGFGLSPKYFETLLGKHVNRDVGAGTPVSWDLIG